MIKDVYLEQIKAVCRAPKNEIDIIVDAFINIMKENLVLKKKVNIVNFGTFSLCRFQPKRLYSPTDGRSLRTGDIYKVYFRQSRELKDYIKKGLE